MWDICMLKSESEAWIFLMINIYKHKPFIKKKKKKKRRKKERKKKERLFKKKKERKIIWPLQLKCLAPSCMDP
jgi:hypothetical protein